MVMISFKVENDAWRLGYYFINFQHPPHSRFEKTGSSYVVFQARLFGLPYNEFLELGQAVYNGELCGKGFISLIYKNKKDADNMCKELNKRYEILVKQIPN